MLIISGGLALLILVLLAVFVSPKAAIVALIIYFMLAYLGHASLHNK